VLKPIAVVRAEAQEEHRLTIEAAFRLARCCRDELGATAVYLFGSRARKDWHRYSDCDVFVLSDRFQGMKPWESWQLIEPLWDGPVDLQPHGLTVAAFENARDKGGLVSMALVDGMISLLEGPEGRVIPPVPWAVLRSS
jgi:predicted nucleotidyltransferase